MLNTYLVKLINNEGCMFDSSKFDNLKTAKKWATGRNGKYKVIIQKNPDYKGMHGYSEKTYEYSVGR